MHIDTKEHRAVSASAYRADIDGLRALAVVPVVLFHVGTPGFFGGFVGVDVFFVISGYLITRIIVAEIEAGAFSLAQFYRRRALRILPALSVMLLATSAVAAMAMLPNELTQFAQSLLATALFASNLYFAEHAGYFAPAAHAAPLLHTWSLAVEEQFYLLWPVLLMLWGHYWRRKIPGWVIAAGLALMSFATAQALLAPDPDGTFYGPHSRAWELMAGALVAMVNWQWLANCPRLREALAAGGLIAILASVKFYNQATPFPGLAALPPVLGAAALIAAGGAGPTRSSQLLAWTPLVWIGKVSFSLYLWHWPVIVYSQTALYQEQTTTTKFALVAVSFGLAALSWRYVEAPFRRGMPAVPTPAVLWRSVTVVAGFTALAGITWLMQGFPARFDERQREIAAFADYPGDQAYRGGKCFVVQPGDPYDEAICLARQPGQPALLLVGDSHAAHLWPGLHAVATGASVLQATATGCRPVLQPQKRGELPCQTFLRRTLTEWLPQHPVDTVILAGRWSLSDLPSLPATIAAIQPYSRRVVVVGPVPQYASALPRLLVHALRSNDPGAVSAGLVRAQFDIDARLHAVVAGTSAHYFSALGALCSQGVCRTYAKEGVPLQFDYGHFTGEGSTLLVSALLTAMTPADPDQAPK